MKNITHIVGYLLFFSQMMEGKHFKVHTPYTILYLDKERTKGNNSLVWKLPEKNASKFKLVSNGQELEIPYNGRCDVHSHIELYNQNESPLQGVYHSVRNTRQTLGVQRYLLTPWEKRGSDVIRLHAPVTKGDRIRVDLNNILLVYSYGYETYLEVTCYPEEAYSFD